MYLNRILSLPASYSTILALKKIMITTDAEKKINLLQQN